MKFSLLLLVAVVSYAADLSGDWIAEVSARGVEE